MSGDFDRSNIDDHAYMRGQIDALVLIVGYLFRTARVGADVSHPQFLAGISQWVRDAFGENDKERLAGADEVIARIQKGIQS